MTLEKNGLLQKCEWFFSQLSYNLSKIVDWQNQRNYVKLCPKMIHEKISHFQWLHYCYLKNQINQNAGGVVGEAAAAVVAADAVPAII